MTYCVAMRLDEGLVFLSADSRTNAGVDQIGTFRKMMVFERPGERVMCLLSAGNLAVTQAVRELLEEMVSAEGKSIWNATSIYEAVQLVGDAVRAVRETRCRSHEPQRHRIQRQSDLRRPDSRRAHALVHDLFRW